MFWMPSLMAIHLIVLLLFDLTDGFPSGAPVDTCDSMIPRHMGSHSMSLKESPYYLVQSSNSYGNNHEGHRKGIKVELGGGLFKGFMIIAVDPLTGRRIGSWVQFKGTDVLPCSAITHSNSRAKRMASLIWIPDPETRGYVAFEATVVRTFREYYTGIVSVLPHQQTLRSQQQTRDNRHNGAQNMP